jgi:hypothetical protein
LMAGSVSKTSKHRHRWSASGRQVPWTALRHFEQRIHGSLPVPQDTAQLMATQIPGADNFSQWNR